MLEILYIKNTVKPQFQKTAPIGPPLVSDHFLPVQIFFPSYGLADHLRYSGHRPLFAEPNCS